MGKDINEQTRAEVDQIIDRIQEPEGSMVDDDFRETCYEIRGLIDKTRNELGFRPYNDNHWVILWNELHWGRVKNRHHKRKNGDPYFDKHLIGTLKNLINDQGLTGISSLLAGAKHDDIEDLGLTRGQLFRTETYRDQLHNFSPAEADRVLDEVYRTVNGVTKVKQGDRKATKEATFRKFFEAIRDNGVRVGYVKTADRTDNILTLDGMGESRKDRQLEIAQETVDIYAPLAHLFKIFKSEEKLIRGSLEALNPRLLREIDQFRYYQDVRFLEPHQANIRLHLEEAKLREKLEFLEVIFENVPFQQLLQNAPQDKPLTHLQFDDLNLDPEDPMFDVVVLLKDAEMTLPMIGQILQRFSLGKTINIDITRLNEDRGILVKVHNPKFGGRMYFRINGAQVEARRRRGILANHEGSMPHGLRHGVNQILEKSAREQISIMDLAKEELLKPETAFFTPEGKEISLPVGATALDFARKIHRDVLLGAQEVTISDNIFGKNRRKISLFEELPPGVFVYIKVAAESVETSGPNSAGFPPESGSAPVIYVPPPRESIISTEEISPPPPPTRSKAKVIPQVKPHWLLFCQQNGDVRSVIHQYLKAAKVPVAKMGEEFLQSVFEVFFPDETIESVLQKIPAMENVTQKSFLFFQSVGRGEINPLNLLSRHPEYAQPSSYCVQVTLQDRPNAMAEFTTKMGHKINVITPNVLCRQGNQTIIRFEVDFDQQKLPPNEFFKTILRLKYEGYKVELRKKNQDNSQKGLMENQQVE